MNFSHDDKLNEIAERTIAGERLSFEDGVALYATEDLPPSVNSPTRFAAAGTAHHLFQRQSTSESDEYLLRRLQVLRVPRASSA